MAIPLRTAPLQAQRRNAITTRSLIQALTKTAIAVAVIGVALYLALTLGTWHAIQVIILLTLLVGLCILIPRLAAPLVREDDR